MLCPSASRFGCIAAYDINIDETQTTMKLHKTRWEENTTTTKDTYIVKNRNAIKVEMKLAKMGYECDGLTFSFSYTKVAKNEKNEVYFLRNVNKTTKVTFIRTRKQLKRH